MTVIRIEKPAHGVTLLTLNRPDARNALSLELREHLTSALSDCASDEAVRAVVLTGGDQIFAAGADLREMASMRPRDMLLRNIETHWRAVAQFPKPLIAAVNGLALGGGFELALHADIILASRGAKFALPEVTLGLMPGGGGTQRLIRAVGKARAMRLLMTGDRLDAQEAFRAGVISEVVEESSAIPAAVSLAARIAKLPPISQRLIKEVSLAGMDGPLETGLALERRAVQILFDTDDLQEGISAFFDKREPVFNGR
ncbi:enoyl-CoA hydratase-related protein [Roseobacter sp. N2S]|uniref:enoyl-CoA hydratase-related protein n=1 Tax=Roseobacter sp. N2S TaxID=2663844 RepID=UPI002860D035|nr:enoyl-CoA hydratase-related protein [Roseobacter sp. N2S]MDR6265830.1 enoyl-CoA hydratase/carnithine racemase [Roseobacter sp. N2S]